MSRFYKLLLNSDFFSLFLLPYFSNGQSIADVIRFSYQESGGTARYTATGGSMGAIGSDLSAVNSNPAGIALYRKSEFSISPSFILSRDLLTYQVDKSFMKGANSLAAGITL